MTVLRSSSPVLEDLARGSPRLHEAEHGRDTGVTLVRCLGAGGMSTVFLGELDVAKRSADLSPLAPPRLAIKFMQASTAQSLEKINEDPMAFFVRETMALGRVMEVQPPTEFVVAFYGSGRADVEVSGRTRRLPWLAIEYVDGGSEGASLHERVGRAVEGVDPIRALRLVRGIVSGVRVLHGEQVIHRDLKPENVLIAGPIDDETPKLADCGIARVVGLGSTVAAMTPAYAGPEQALSTMGVRNPLIGLWTDVHALAAVVWFVLGGEPWCRSEVDPAWMHGERRSLRTAARLHPAFAMDARLLDQLDAVLRRGAAHRLPEAAWAAPGAEAYASRSRAHYPSMFAPGAARFATVDELASALLPLLEECAARWTARAVQENRAPTAFRPTQLLSLSRLDLDKPPARVREATAKSIAGTETSLRDGAVAPATPRCVVFQPDGKVLARFGDRLVYFVNDEPRKVGVPAEHRAAVLASEHLVRGPGGGFALVGPSHVVLIRGGSFVSMPLPVSPSGGEVGQIQAVVGDGRVFGVVTAETDDSNGGPELWRSTDGVTWGPPSVLPLGGEVRDIAYGPYGFLVVGARKGKQPKGRALFLGLDDQTTVFTAGVNDKPALHIAIASAARAAWGAGLGFVLRFERGAATPEATTREEAPVAMGLDMVGVPWLVTERAVLRRHVDQASATWKIYYEREASRPPLVAIGFTPDGALVLDAEGSTVHIEPHDVDSWSKTSMT